MSKNVGAHWMKVLVSAAVVILWWLLQQHVASLEYDRQQIIVGEFWRLWTGHWVHTNAQHFFLNAAALLLLYFFFWFKAPLTGLIFYTVIFSTLISAALWWFQPQLGWYNGFSGALHALVAFYCLRRAKDGDRYLLVLLLLVWVKVLAETARSLLGYETMQGSMRVITAAHLAGAVIGTAAAMILRLYNEITGSRLSRLMNTTVT